MKKITFILLIGIALFTLVGCKSGFKDVKLKETANFKYINHISTPSIEKEYKSLDREFISNYNDFAYKALASIYRDKNNNLYSPASLYMSLSMLLEGADGNSYDQIRNALGSTSYIKTINKNLYANNYYQNDKGEARMANSYWININANIKEDYINTLNDNYYAEGFKTRFDDTAKSNMAKWINSKTKDLLNVKKEDFNNLEDMELCVINTIYFDNKWNKEFKTSNNTVDKFYTDEEVNCTYMYHEISSFYYVDESYSAVSDNFYNGNSITYILPNEGVDIKDIINNINFRKTDEYSHNSYNVKLYVPKFKYNVKLDLEPILRSMGIVDIFSTTDANLSKISDDYLYISEITQGAGIEFSEEGVKAASYTKWGTKATAMEIPTNTIIFKLNRPFIYYISDSNGCILFMGTINNPNK